MKKLNLAEVEKYVNNNIDTFHVDRIRKLRDTKLKDLIDKNPYLSKAKNVNKASELVEGALLARLSSSEEELFGQFLEGLAIFIATKTTGGHKSGAEGIDLEFNHKGWHYFISIKSGTNWGNGSQQSKQEENFTTALKVFRQNKGQKTKADAILGICYGKTKTNRVRGALKLVGQNFWTFISGNQNLYKEIIEPIGYKAKEHNEAYNKEYDRIVNKLTGEFLNTYCEDNLINWDLLIEATCGNYDLDEHGLDT